MIFMSFKLVIKYKILPNQQADIDQISYIGSETKLHASVNDVNVVKICGKGVNVNRILVIKVFFKTSKKSLTL